jgi:hypothetical protein
MSICFHKTYFLHLFMFDRGGYRKWLSYHIEMDTDLTMNKNTNLTIFVLDPLSVIIKLAIISNKPVGTKFRIFDNMIQLQEPGLFQSIVRYYFSANKTEIQYLYNPISLACNHFLNMRCTEKTPAIMKLFKCALVGLEKLKETYGDCPIIVLCLHSYSNLIENYLEGHYNDALFKKDAMTAFYRTELVALMNSQWNPDRIKMVLDMIEFLCKDYAAANYVQSLEIFINNIDLNMKVLTRG